MIHNLVGEECPYFFSGAEPGPAADYQKERERIRRQSQIARDERRRLTLSPALPPVFDEKQTASQFGTEPSSSPPLAAMTSSAVDQVDSQTDGQDNPTVQQASQLSFLSRLFSEDIISKRNKSKRVTLNVGGQRHEVLWSTLERIPNTRLGKLRRCVTHASIMALCDDYDIVNNEYYFDRHPTAFSTVIDFYRTGKLHILDDVCMMSYSDELEYWGIEEFYLEPCCLTKFNQRRDHLLEEMRKDSECLHPDEEEHFGTGRYNRARQIVWDLLEKPNSSRPAKVK